MRTLQRLSVSGTIALGFAVVLVLHLTVAVVGHAGLERASGDLEELGAERELADRIVAIDDDVGRLQREILNYARTGHPAVAARIRELEQRLQRALATTVAHASWEDLAALAEMRASLERYGTQFEALVVDRQRRRQLLDVELEASGRALETAIAELLAQVYEADDPWLVVDAEHARNDLARSLYEVQRYLSKLDPAAIRAARGHLEDIRRHTATAAAALGPQADGVAERVEAELPRFLAHLNELVQVTRGYLHLVNVVLAGEAGEFQYESARLRARNLERLDALTASIATEQREFQRASFWISLVTIGMGVVAAGGVRRAVVRPLVAIAATLTRLAEAEDGSAASPRIPGVDRADEVGAMARAAEVFRRRGERTAGLLQESRRLELEHQTVIRDLERTNAELDEFANVASHDLKAPLRAISSLTEWIEEDMPEELPADVRSHLAALRSRTNRMGKLLGDLLVYSRARRADFEVTDVDLRALADDLVGLIGLPPGFEFVYTGDDVRLCTARVPLEQVLGNLISNAIKHHDRAEGRIELAVTDHGDTVELRVGDDGPGIPAKHHARIFEPFRTLRPRDDVEASGVGLALVARHVQRFGGEVRVLSPGDERGSVFVVHWPRRACCTADAPPPACAQDLVPAPPQERDVA